MRYAGLTIVSLIYRLLGLLLVILGVVFGVKAAGGGGVGAFLAVFLSGLGSGLAFLGVGQLLRLQLDVEQNLRKAADAMERAAK